LAIRSIPTTWRRSTATPARDSLDRGFLDRALHGVDGGIGFDHLPAAVGIAMGERADRLDGLLLDQPAHFRDQARERTQLVVEYRCRMPGRRHHRVPFAPTEQAPGWCTPG